MQAEVDSCKPLPLLCIPFFGPGKGINRSSSAKRFKSALFTPACRRGIVEPLT